MVQTLYTFFSDGFFGYGAKGDFRYWSLAHFLPILLALGVIFLIYWKKDAIRSWKNEENLRFIIGFLLLLVEMSYYWRLIYVGSSKADEGTLMDKMPFQVCQWTCILSAFMIMKKSRHLYAVCYFVCLTLGLMPLATPAVIVSTGPGYYRYYQFWLEHLLPIIAVFYMTFVHGFRVKISDVWKPYLLLCCLVVGALWGNSFVEGANYLYLAANTDGDSVANLLPASIPVRLGLYAIASVVLFALAYLPMHICKRKAYKTVN